MTLSGIDVSAAGQGASFPWGQYHGRVAFAFAKVSEGLGFADPDARANIAQMRSLGLVAGGYHFLHNELSGAQQAEYFLSCAERAGLHAGDLVAVDVEDEGLGGINRNDPGAVKQALIHFDMVACDFTARLRKHHPVWPEFYTEISIAPHMTSNGNCPLWLANPDRVHTGPVGPWAGPSFEQVGQTGVDTDVFYGDLAALAKLTIPH